MAAEPFRNDPHDAGGFLAIAGMGKAIVPARAEFPHPAMPVEHSQWKSSNAGVSRISAPFHAG